MLYYMNLEIIWYLINTNYFHFKLKEFFQYLEQNLIQEWACMIQWVFKPLQNKKKIYLIFNYWKEHIYKTLPMFLSLDKKIYPLENALKCFPTKKEDRAHKNTFSGTM